MEKEIHNMNSDQDKITEINTDNIGEGNPHKVYELIVDGEKRNKDSEDLHLIENVNNIIIMKSEKKTTKEGKISFRKKKIISIVDSLISVCIIAPMCIGFWRGLWSLLDIYAERLTGWGCFVIGFFLHTCFAVLQNIFHKKLAGNFKPKNICHRILSRALRYAYTYLFGFGCITQWRGGWIIFDYYLLNLEMGLFACFIGIFLKEVIVLRSARNLLSAPFLVILDKPSYTFKFPTRYKVNSKDWSLYILDCAFSVGIVGTLVVFVWRGVWVIFDIYLFPGEKEQSSIGSLIIGYALVSISFLLQPVMRYTCAKLLGFPKLVLADAFILLSFLATVNVWRGIWNLLDLWLIPENHEMSCWITHIGCFIFLVLLNCSNSILVRGVYIDAEEDKGKCVVFPCHYLRLLFKIERAKKEARRQNLIVVSKNFSTHIEANEKESENGALLNSVVTPMILQGNHDIP